MNRLFVRPSSQGRGIGSALVAWCKAQAEARRLDTYLIAVPHPHAFYLNHGFVDVDRWEVDLAPWGPVGGGLGMFRFSGMVRKWEQSK